MVMFVVIFRRVFADKFYWNVFVCESLECYHMALNGLTLAVWHSVSSDLAVDYDKCHAPNCCFRQNRTHKLRKSQTHQRWCLNWRIWGIGLGSVPMHRWIGWSSDDKGSGVNSNWGKFTVSQKKIHHPFYLCVFCPMSSSFGNSCQKHTPGNMKQKCMHHPPYLVLYVPTVPCKN